MSPPDPGPRMHVTMGRHQKHRTHCGHLQPTWALVLLALPFALFSLTLTDASSPASSVNALVKESSPYQPSNGTHLSNRTHHHHPHRVHHHHPHLHHNTSTNSTSTLDVPSPPGHHPPETLFHLVEPSSSSKDHKSALLPLPPSGGVDPQLLPTSLDGSPVDLSNLNPKGLKFEEEPSDSYIVRSKSAILRCKTLNALNAWFTCNSGDERKIQSNQKISNYVDPEKGIRMIEIDLEVSRSDVEEHTNSGYTNPFQCWCTAYGGQHQIMSRKASVSFSYLKRHFYNEPLARSAAVGASQIMFDCLPPEGDPAPVVFWLKNDVIIAERFPKNAHGSASSIGSTVQLPKTVPLKKYNSQKVAISGLKSQYKAGKRKLKERAVDGATLALPEVDPAKLHPAGHEAFPDPYGAQQNLQSKGTAAQVKPGPLPTLTGDDEEEEDDEEYEDDGEEDEEEEVHPNQKSKEHQPDDGGELLPLHFDDGHGPLGSNYLMTHDYSLVVQQVTLADAGNYTCAVRNPAGVRFSAPAQLTVFVNGEWSNWGSWSSCHLPAGQKCGRGTQKRVRHCSNPTPIANAQFCAGEPVQVMECNVICSSIVGSGSYWSPWNDWTPCGHDCTQVRRRVCNNPTPEIGAHDCFGPDFMVRNCTGGLCRKIFDPLLTPALFPPPSGPILQPGPAVPAHSNEQLYFLIIFLLTLIILLCILYIALKFLNRRRHRGAKSAGYHSSNGWADMLQLERGGGSGNDEDAQAMLMLLQQQHQSGSLPGGPGVQLPMSGLGSSSAIARYRSSGQMTPRSHPFGTTSSSSSSASGHSTTQQQQPEKYQFISRLKHNISGTSKPNLLLDHLVLRGQAESGSGGHHPPLPTIPSINSLNSFTSSGMNKYEEPVFPGQQLGSNSRGSHPSANSHYLHGKPPLPPNQPTPSALSNTSGSNGTATISTNTTNTSESENSNESEPDYAEPIINNYSDGSSGSGGGGGGQVNGPRPPSVPPPLTSSSTPLLPRSAMHHHHPSPHHTTGSSSSSSPEIAFGKHEKFIKLSNDLLIRGHLSSMPNLGVGIYLPPGLIEPGYSTGYSSSDHLYLRYGIDTAAKLSSPSSQTYSSLSSVVTVSFSKSPGTGPVPPTSAELLSRPFILAFRHCIAVRGGGNSVAGLAKMLAAKNLTVLWQDLDGGTGPRSSSWSEVLRYGEENLNTACYLELDATSVYLVSRYVGRYMLAVRCDVPGTRQQLNESLASPQLGPSGSSLDFSKLVNFSLSIEQLSASEHLIKVFAYDNLPSSTLSLRNELSPAGHASSSCGAIRLRLGKNTSTSALRLSSRGGSLFFELKPPAARHRIKGLHRVELPLSHLWFASGSNPVHVAFIVANNSTVIRECTRKQCNTGSTGLYENEEPEELEPELESSGHSDDSDEIVTETDQESVAEEVRPRSRNTLDHFHETEAELNYEVTIWQGPKGGAPSTAPPISNVVTLNSSTTVRLCQPANTSLYYVERCFRHLFTEADLHIRDQLVDRLDQPRPDQLDWRSLASAAGFDHYMPYFASQQSPSTSILELWEAKVLNGLVQKGSGGCGTSATSPDLAKVKDIFYSKLVHLLQTIQRTDLIEIILSNTC